MRNVKIKPIVSAQASKGMYDATAGFVASKGPASLSVVTSKGTGYPATTDINLDVAIPITKKVKGRCKL